MSQGMIHLGALRERPSYCDNFAADLSTWLWSLTGTKSPCSNYTEAELRADQEQTFRNQTCVKAADPERCVKEGLAYSDKTAERMTKTPPSGDSGSPPGENCDVQAMIDWPIATSIVGTGLFCPGSGPGLVTYGAIGLGLFIFLKVISRKK